MAGPSARRARTSLRLRALDARDRLSGRRGRLVPPRRLQFVGEGDFVWIGDEFLSHLVALCGLRAEDRVLDVGCGIGRLARPLAGYLSIDGAYAGFDVDAAGIRWCTQRYGHFPQFAFAHADVRNARYNPGGPASPSTYRFPYDDGAFDVAVLISVLTHLTADAALHYLGQTRRVLAPGGRVLLTAFVLDPDAPDPALAFGPAPTGWRSSTRRCPRRRSRSSRTGCSRRCGRRASTSSRSTRARWTGRADGLSFQDVVVARA